METYNTQSCSALEKPFYRPIEAALRWCNLINMEGPILAATGALIYPAADAFPLYPCLRLNAEKIFDAIENGELRHGRSGRIVATTEHVAPGKLTVRHTDLKAWMAKHYPDQKPKFLFDEIERNTHAMYNAETFQALQGERDAAKASIEVARQRAEGKDVELNSIRSERDALAAQVKATDPLDPRERKSLLIIIAALCKDAGYDYTTASKTAGRIQSTAAGMSVTIGETTIEEHLKKIPYALETTMK